MTLIWSIAAKESYLAIIEQIFLKWNITIVEQFENQVKDLLNNISHHNYICPKSSFENLHKCVINNHNSLIYKVKDNNTLEIVAFVFNRSEHIF